MSEVATQRKPKVFWRHDDGVIDCSKLNVGSNLIICASEIAAATRAFDRITIRLKGSGESFELTLFEATDETDLDEAMFQLAWLMGYAAKHCKR